MDILDVGCGEEKRGKIGIDIEKTSKVDVLCDAHFLPFLKESFKKCYAFAVLEHVDNPREVLKEINRVLKFKGKLKILVPTDSRLRSDYVSLILSLRFKHLLDEYRAMRSGEHKWQYSRMGLKNLLEMNGFQVENLHIPAIPFVSGRRVGKILKKIRFVRHAHIIVDAVKNDVESSF